MDQNEQLKLIAAGVALQNQDKQIQNQRILLEQNQRIQDETAKNAVLSKLSEVLMDGVESEFQDPIFLKRFRIFITSAHVIQYAGNVFAELVKHPSLLPFVLDVWAQRDDIRISWTRTSKIGGREEVLSPVEMAFQIYHYGFFSVKEDRAKAFLYASIGSERGFVKCQSYLGWALIKGVVCSIDYVRAKGLLESAAVKGDAAAICHLAKMHLEGQGVPKNDQKAESILEKGIQGGHDNEGGIAGTLANEDRLWEEGSEALVKRHKLFIGALEKGTEINSEAFFKNAEKLLGGFPKDFHFLEIETIAERMLKVAPSIGSEHRAKIDEHIAKFESCGKAARVKHYRFLACAVALATLVVSAVLLWA